MTLELPEKRQRILSAALEVGLKRGLAATHMEEIAEAAGVSKGTLYNFFESREQLLVEAVLLSYVDTVVLPPEVDDPTVSPQRRLHVLIESLAESFDRVVSIFPMATQARSLAPPGSEAHFQLLNGLNAAYVGYRQIVADLLTAAQRAGELRDHVDINVVAAVWVATYNGLLYRAGFDERGDDSLCTPDGVRTALGWLLSESLLAPTRVGVQTHSESKQKDPTS